MKPFIKSFLILFFVTIFSHNVYAAAGLMHRSTNDKEHSKLTIETFNGRDKIATMVVDYSKQSAIRGEVTLADGKVMPVIFSANKYTLKIKDKVGEWRIYYAIAIGHSETWSETTSQRIKIEPIDLYKERRITTTYDQNGNIQGSAPQAPRYIGRPAEPVDRTSGVKTEIVDSYLGWLVKFKNGLALNTDVAYLVSDFLDEMIERKEFVQTIEDGINKIKWEGVSTSLARALGFALNKLNTDGKWNVIEITNMNKAGTTSVLKNAYPSFIPIIGNRLLVGDLISSIMSDGTDNATKKTKLTNLRNQLERLFSDQDVTIGKEYFYRDANVPNAVEVLAAIGKIDALLGGEILTPVVEKKGAADLSYLRYLNERIALGSEISSDDVKKIIDDDMLTKLLDDEHVLKSMRIALANKLIKALAQQAQLTHSQRDKLASIMTRPELYTTKNNIPVSYGGENIGNEIVEIGVKESWPFAQPIWVYMTPNHGIGDNSSIGNIGALRIEKLLQEVLLDVEPESKRNKLETIKEMLNLFFVTTTDLDHLEFKFHQLLPSSVYSALGKVNAELALLPPASLQQELNLPSQKGLELPQLTSELPVADEFNLTPAEQTKVVMHIVDNVAEKGLPGTMTDEERMHQFIEEGWLDQLINMGQQDKSKKVIKRIFENLAEFPRTFMTEERRGLLAATISRLDYEGAGVGNQVVNKGEIRMHLVSDPSWPLRTLPGDQDNDIILNLEALISPAEGYVDADKAKAQLNEIKQILESAIFSPADNPRVNMFDVYKALGRVNRILNVINNPDYPIRQWEGELDAGLIKYMDNKRITSLSKADVQMLVDDGLLIKMFKNGKFEEAEGLIITAIQSDVITSPKQRDLLAYIASEERQAAYEDAEKDFKLPTNLKVKEARAEKILKVIKDGPWPFTDDLSSYILTHRNLGNVADRKLPLGALIDDAIDEENKEQKILKLTAIRDILLNAYFKGLSFDATFKSGDRIPLSIYTALGRVNAWLEESGVPGQNGPSNLASKVASSDETLKVSFDDLEKNIDNIELKLAPPRGAAIYGVKHNNKGQLTGFTAEHEGEKASLIFEYETQGRQELVEISKILSNNQGTSFLDYVFDVSNPSERHVTYDLLSPVAVTCDFDFKKKEVVTAYSSFNKVIDNVSSDHWMNVTAEYFPNGTMSSYTKSETKKNIKNEGARVSILFYDDGGLKQVKIEDMSSATPRSTVKLYYPSSATGGIKNVEKAMLRSRVDRFSDKMISFEVRNPSNNRWIIVKPNEPMTENRFLLTLVNAENKPFASSDNKNISWLNEPTNIEALLTDPALKGYVNELTGAEPLTDKPKDNNEEILSTPARDLLLRDPDGVFLLPMQGPVSRVVEVASENNNLPKKIVSEYDGTTCTLDFTYDEDLSSGIVNIEYSGPKPRSSYLSTFNKQKEIDPNKSSDIIYATMPIQDAAEGFTMQYRLSTDASDILCSVGRRRVQSLSSVAPPQVCRPMYNYYASYDEKGVMKSAIRETSTPGMPLKIESLLFYPGGLQEKAYLKTIKTPKGSEIRSLEIYNVYDHKIFSAVRKDGALWFEAGVIRDKLLATFSDPSNIEKVMQEFMSSATAEGDPFAFSVYKRSLATVLDEDEEEAKNTKSAPIKPQPPTPPKYSDETILETIDVLNRTPVYYLPEPIIKRLINDGLLVAIIEKEKAEGTGNSISINAWVYTLMVVLDKNDYPEMTADERTGLKIKLQQIVASTKLETDKVYDHEKLKADPDYISGWLDKTGELTKAVEAKNDKGISALVVSLLSGVGNGKIDIYFKGMIDAAKGNNDVPEYKAEILNRTLALSTILTYYITYRDDVVKGELRRYGVNISSLSWKVLRFGGEVVNEATKFADSPEGMREGFKLKASMDEADKMAKDIKTRYQRGF